jgi:hypothetical protein
VAKVAEDDEFRRYTLLDVDLMYYFGAKRNLAAAKAAWPEVEKHLKTHQDAAPEFDRASADFQQDQEKHQRAFERICIHLENVDVRVGMAMAPVLEHLAITHMLCASCLEAHINQHARDVLAGKEYDDFDKISLTGKWRFLPKLLGKPGFESGAEPFQSFDRLVGWRRREEWNSKPIPDFREKLGLTIKQGEAAVAATRSMLEELGTQLGKPIDAAIWDELDTWTYFNVAFGSTKVTLK